MHKHYFIKFIFIHVSDFGPDMEFDFVTAFLQINFKKLPMNYAFFGPATLNQCRRTFFLTLARLLFCQYRFKLVGGVWYKKLALLCNH